MKELSLLLDANGCQNPAAVKRRASANIPPVIGVQPASIFDGQQQRQSPHERGRRDLASLAEKRVGLIDDQTDTVGSSTGGTLPPSTVSGGPR